jgi:ABC-2 type transport system permease protein
MILEIRKWYRSKRVFLLISICSLMGVTAPLFTYYSKDILKSMGGYDASNILLPDPTWISATASYFKNVEQIIVFVVIFVVAEACLLGKNESLKLFYKTNAKTPSKIYTPKLIAGLLFSFLGLLVGDLINVYMVWALFDNKVQFGHLAGALCVQMVVFLVLITLGATLGIYTSSPFLSAVLIEGFLMVTGLLGGVEVFKNWSPTVLLSPVQFLSKAVNLNHIWQPTLVGFIILILCGISIKNKRISRQSN